ncbi:MAG: hypothetical protein L7S63_03345 [Flavobacteriales bacterium]|nr:hypothetical protein [Flavobacteriales bacterium]
MQFDLVPAHRGRALARHTMALAAMTLFLMVWSAGAWGQIETGTWQDLPNFTKGRDIAAVDGAPLLLVAGETAVYGMGVDAEGRSTGEVQRFGKADGLSRSDVAALALARETGLAIVGYVDGTFDLVAFDVDGTLGQVTAVKDLAEADLPGSKRPNQLVVEGERLLVCTDIGVVEFDLGALEVRDTWKLEQNGQALPIRSAVLAEDRWWLATAEGVWSAPVNAAFPGDPATWEQEQALPATDIRSIVRGSDGRLALIERRDGADAIWLRPAGQSAWQETTGEYSEQWTALASDGERLWASTVFGILETDADWLPTSLRTDAGSLYLQPNGLAAAGGGCWLANAHSGALWLDSGGQSAAFEGPFAPNGPRSNAAWRIDAWNDRLWVATGGTESSGVPLYRREGFSGRIGTYWWTISSPEGEAGAEGVQDPMEVSIDPTRPERAVFGSLEEGLIEVEGPQVSRFWNPSNAPLEWNANWSTSRCTVTALDFDRQGNLWLLNEGTERPLKLLDAEGNWHEFDVEGLDVSTRFTRVLATQADQLWILLGDGEGVVVMSTGGTPADPSDDDVRFLTQQEGEGGLPSSFVYAVEEDLDGEIWVGTLQGPAVFYQPQALFTAEGFDAQQILIEQDGNFQLLLETETVWDIALDGGNRKWLATVNNGVFLLSPDGREQVAHFTAQNSPLPADEVYDLAIDQSSGLVYFATPMGMTSYRGEATNFTAELGTGPLRIFPNPWKPEFAPRVTVDGLAFASEVHVLNAAGERVRKLESAGGRAVWDTMDDVGRPVPEGVYFLLAGEAAGKSGTSSKMVILR